MSEKTEHASQVENGPHLRGTVENKAAKPAGLLPKNTQQLVILGVAVVMVLIMWLTGGAKHAPKTGLGATSAASVEPPDRAVVQDFKQTIQKEQAATRQPISASDFARLQAIGLAGDVPPGSTVETPDGSEPLPGGVIRGSTQAGPPASDPVKEDKKKREYLSLFATNVAFTSRKGEVAEKLVGQHPTTDDSPSSTDQRMAPPSSANDVETQLHQAESQFMEANRAAAQAAQAGLAPTAAPQQQGQPVPETKAINPNSSQPGAFNSPTWKQYVVFEGSILETLLINRLNGTFAGPVNCLVTSNTYSHDGQHILIPAGTKVLGEAKKVEALGQQRLAVSFHRLIMPDGFSVNLDQFRGLNQIGETALRDKVSNHYLQIFGASLAIGILGGIAEAGTGNVLTNSPLEEARAGFGSNLANSSMQILDRFLNILPTVTIREGNRVKVYLSGDLVLPDYADHTVKPDL
jgi:type IV secretory pathway VirB10-like protein